MPNRIILALKRIESKLANVFRHLKKSDGIMKAVLKMNDKVHK
jgi:hypothetical protein